MKRARLCNIAHLLFLELERELESRETLVLLDGGLAGLVEDDLQLLLGAHAVQTLHRVVAQLLGQVSVLALQHRGQGHDDDDDEGEDDDDDDDEDMMMMRHAVQALHRVVARLLRQVATPS